MKITSELIDFDKIQKMVGGLSDINKDKTIKEGLRSATAIFVRAGRRNLIDRMKNKNHTGNLVNSFRNKVKRKKLGSIAGFSGLGSHAHLVDLGTDERYTKGGKRKAHSTGAAKGNHFWTNAVDSNKDKAIDQVYIGIERAMQKIMSRN